MKKAGTFLLIGLSIAFVGFLIGMLVGRNLNSAPATIRLATQATTLPIHQTTSDTATGSVELVNINTASAMILDALPGIGPILANRIVEYRQEHGPFQDVTDITNVEGIGPEKLLAILDLITVED